MLEWSVPRRVRIDVIDFKKIMEEIYMRLSLGFVVASTIMLGACAVDPAVQRTTTTLGEVNMEGMECRRVGEVGSLMKRTICASPQQWAESDKEDKRATDEMLARARSYTSDFKDRFGGN